MTTRGRPSLTVKSDVGPTDAPGIATKADGRLTMTLSLHLPAGDWDIRVELALNQGAGCEGSAVDLSPTVRVHVTDAAAPSS